jgi:hypothetical protein
MNDKIREIVEAAEGHITVDEHGGITCSGPAGVALFRLLTLRSGLRLELSGIRVSRGVSCYAIAKREFGFKGNKQKVFDQLNAALEAVHPGYGR